jgi:hypothetical protein
MQNYIVIDPIGIYILEVFVLYVFVILESFLFALKIVPVIEYALLARFHSKLGANIFTECFLRNHAVYPLPFG